MDEEKNVIGFRIEGYNNKSVKAIKKNAKVPLLLKTLISCEIIIKEPYTVEIKLKPKFFKKSKNDSTKKLVISSTEKLVSAINLEMIKSECVEGLDYSLEVLRE